jgi:23S rRNA A2030 N6-methylase RlmJ
MVFRNATLAYINRADVPARVIYTHASYEEYDLASPTALQPTQASGGIIEN